MKILKACLVLVSVAALCSMFDLFFTVSEYEQAVITRLGTPVASVKEAGLHLKIPFIQKVTSYEKRGLRWDSGPLEIPAGDGVVIGLDVAARWRIVDPARFFETVGTYEHAYSRLDDIIDSIVKDKVSTISVSELVRSSALIDVKETIAEEGGRTPDPSAGETDRKIVPGRGRIAGSICSEASRSLSQFGVELMDVRFKRLSYPGSTTAKVFERMVSERKYRAARLRSEGEGRKAELLGQMEKELRSIRSEAEKSAEEIKGRADAEAARIYGRAYGKDPEFAAFYKTLQTYRETPFDNTTLILGTDSEFYRFLKGTKR